MPKGATEDGGTVGPSWWDVWDYCKALEHAHGRKVSLVAEPSRSSGKIMGFRVTAKWLDAVHPFGCAGYGRAYPGTGTKTMAAAYYAALVRLDEASADWLASIEAEQLELLDITVED